MYILRYLTYSKLERLDFLERLVYNGKVRGENPMSVNNEKEFHEIIKDILKIDKFDCLQNELHHGISRYHHCLRVAKGTYVITKKMHMDYERATRAALLHDFFTDEDTALYDVKEKFKIHPDIALKNASKYFLLDPKQANIIASHMFPVCKVKPKYKEAWITSFVDKGVAFYEIYRFKVSLVMGIWILFLFNMLSIQK